MPAWLYVTLLWIILALPLDITCEGNQYKRTLFISVEKALVPQLAERLRVESQDIVQFLFSPNFEVAFFATCISVGSTLVNWIKSLSFNSFIVYMLLRCSLRFEMFYCENHLVYSWWITDDLSWTYVGNVRVLSFMIWRDEIILPDVKLIYPAWDI